MKLVQEEAKQQTWKVKEQTHKCLKIQLGLVQENRATTTRPITIRKKKRRETRKFAQESR